MDCTSCTKFAGTLIDANGLCRLKGPIKRLDCCRNYTEQITDIIILNDKFCHTCAYFQPALCPQNQSCPSLFQIQGFCIKYDFGKYNGYTRKACSKYKQSL